MLFRSAAGALAMQVLESYGIKIWAYTSQIGNIHVSHTYQAFTPEMVDTNPVRCPDSAAAAGMTDLIRRAKQAGDSIGGVITCIIQGCPAGLGEPVFDKLQARLASGCAATTLLTTAHTTSHSRI